MVSTGPRIVLTIECANRIGIIAAVAQVFADHGCDIVDSQQFDDHRGERFYMRVEATTPEELTVEGLRAAFSPVADAFEMTWHLSGHDERMRTLIMVSHTDHCLKELLDLWSNNLLKVDIVGVVGNHETLRSVVEAAGLPFHHLPVTSEIKPRAEATLMQIIEDTRTELVVLARYMQILSDELCSRLPGRVINIHHSFLPGFKGARPYHQAFDRGVKVIGATAHYVTADLDEGPIIAQSVFDVDHRATASDLVIAGRRAERAALAQAVAWHAERRVFINGLRTVIFG